MAEVKDIIDSMADEIDYPGFAGTLPMISQYYLMNKSSKGMIIEKVKNFGKMGEEPIKIHPLYEFRYGPTLRFMIGPSGNPTVWMCMMSN